ncbi:hypothetical protein Anapl_11907 [Anas platyrhynchos]|uniref:Uncharacterized protein n=1 Tax=Anas platyrhynchos TaxID=8839 RepID=R0LRN7_ANAPL|nr:hypothetical protein Anapl_11907 [Anas platyrhynchos]
MLVANAWCGGYQPDAAAIMHAVLLKSHQNALSPARDKEEDKFQQDRILQTSAWVAVCTLKADAGAPVPLVVALYSPDVRPSRSANLSTMPRGTPGGDISWQLLLARAYHSITSLRALLLWYTAAGSHPEKHATLWVRNAVLALDGKPVTEPHGRRATAGGEIQQRGGKCFSARQVSREGALWAQVLAPVVHSYVAGRSMKSSHFCTFLFELLQSATHSSGLLLKTINLFVVWLGLSWSPAGFGRFQSGSFTYLLWTTLQSIDFSDDLLYPNSSQRHFYAHKA